MVCKWFEVVLLVETTSTVVFGFDQDGDDTDLLRGVETMGERIHEEMLPEARTLSVLVDGQASQANDRDREFGEALGRVGRKFGSIDAAYDKAVVTEDEHRLECGNSHEGACDTGIVILTRKVREIVVKSRFPTIETIADVAFVQGFDVPADGLDLPVSAFHVRHVPAFSDNGVPPPRVLDEGEGGRREPPRNQTTHEQSV